MGESISLTIKQIKGKDFSRSLYFVKNLKPGDTITENDIKSIRPGFGLHPKYLHELIGKKVNKSIEIGDRVTLEIIF